MYCFLFNYQYNFVEITENQTNVANVYDKNIRVLQYYILFNTKLHG